MLSIDFTFLWTAINLLILYLFLKKFLFGRVGKYMEARAQQIAKDIEQGEALKAEGEESRQAYAAMLERAVDEKQQILAEARQTAERQGDEVLAAARTEAARIVEAAHSDAQRQQQQLMAGMRDEVASLALGAASKVVEANMDNEKNRQLVDEFLKREGVA